MKSTSKKNISVLLAITLLFTGTTFASATDGEAADNSGIMFATNLINGILNAVFKGFGSLFPNDAPTLEEYESENFYEGTEIFLDEPAENAKWKLGFGKASMVPENLRNGSKQYYTGGYFTQKINGVYDDQGANAVAMTDSSGRGTVVMVAIDGIGVNNADVRTIRAMAEEKLLAKGVFNDIVAI
ncbi:MAG: hypothetical protein IJE63_05080, partial [Clostridia bacterium]|nr:hypothetical protein [Clostridia bacterium]